MSGATTMLNLQVNSAQLPSYSCCFVIKVFWSCEATVAGRRPTHQWHANLASCQRLWLLNATLSNNEVIEFIYRDYKPNYEKAMLRWHRGLFLFSRLNESLDDFPRNTVMKHFPGIRAIFVKTPFEVFLGWGWIFLGQASSLPRIPPC